ncbi:MAG: hypothetical protein KW788_02055 [Candidatus Doudnabacteria bacterium]|nr:hypothetical protein [Candidatus Doudnabacteria bacterium]
MVEKTVEILATHKLLIMTLYVGISSLILLGSEPRSLVRRATYGIAAAVCIAIIVSRI